MRRSGTGPSLPCSGPWKFWSFSSLLEERQHAVPVPAGGAARRPVVVVRRKPAHRHHAVDRRGAADHAALRVAAARTVVGRVAGAGTEGGGEAGPGEARIGMRGGGEAVEHLARLVAGRVVVAGLDQQHVVARPRAQPVGEHAAGRAGAEDDEVVLSEDMARPRAASWIRAALRLADWIAWSASIRRLVTHPHPCPRPAHARRSSAPRCARSANDARPRHARRGICAAARGPHRARARRRR